MLEDLFEEPDEAFFASAGGFERGLGNGTDSPRPARKADIVT